MRALIVGRLVAASAHHIRPLPHTAGRQVDSGADGIPRTPGTPNQLQPNPMMFVRIHISQKDRRLIQAIDHHIDFPAV